MAVDIAEIAPSTGATAAPPVEPVETPTPDETTPEAGRGQAQEPVESTGETETPSEPPAAPRPKLSELLRDPDYAREHAGIVGEREQRARNAAVEEERRRQEAAQIEQYQQNERKLLGDERNRREAEAAELQQLLNAGEAWQHFERAKAIKERQDGWNQWWEATTAQRRQASAVQDVVVKALGQKDAANRTELDAIYKQFPDDVKRAIGKRDYNSLSEIWGHWSETIAEHASAQVQAEFEKYKASEERRWQAREKKLLGELNLSTEDFDLGGGSPVAGQRFHSREQAEAAFKKGEITNADMVNLIDSGLTYARDRRR